MKLSIVIQAGGESKRMGTNKALVPFHGVPLIQRVVSRVSGIADELCITSNAPDCLEYLGFPVYPDFLPGKGALSGLYTALRVAACPLVAVIACDMVFASSSLLSAEAKLLAAGDWDGVVPQTAEGYEPFHAVYRREICRDHIDKAMNNGIKKAHGWFCDAHMYYLKPEQISRHDPSGRAFININTPQQLAEAEQLNTSV